jgi:ABC-2 type transport system permease protein
MAHQDSQTIVSPAPLGGSTPVHTLPAGASLGTPSLWLSVGTLWLREIRSFYRQRSRVIGGLATPLVFWLLLGSGFGTSLRVSSGAGYLEFFFPGTLALVILFTAIFSNISVIEDRREGFLLSVLVAPVSRLALVLGKILGATTIGVLQGLLLLPLAPLAGLPLDVARLPALVGCMVLVAFGLTGLGFFFAWWLNSVQGFHSVMNVVLLPMWLLSGAVFPPEGASVWVRWVMAVNPLTYGVGALQHFFSPEQASTAPSFGVSVAVMIAFAVATLAAAFYQATRRSAENLS